MAAAQGRSSWYYMDETYAKQWQLIMMINWWVYMSNVYAIASEVISSPIRIENNSVRASVFRLNDKQMFVSFSWLSWVGGTEALQESCILTVRIRDDRMRIKESTNLDSVTRPTIAFTFHRNRTLPNSRQIWLSEGYFDRFLLFFT